MALLPSGTGTEGETLLKFLAHACLADTLSDLQGPAPAFVKPDASRREKKGRKAERLAHFLALPFVLRALGEGLPTAKINPT